MDLGNPFEVVIHNLLIGEMTYLSHQDEFSIIRLLVNMFTHWIGLMVSYKINYYVVMTSPSCYVVRLPTLRGYEANAKVFSDFDLPMRS